MALTLFDPRDEMLRRMRENTFAGRIKPGEDVAEWQASARHKLEKLLGLPFENVDPQTEICWTRENEYGTETRLIVYSEKDARVPCHLLLPKDGGEKLPLMVCLQGHSTGMHISLGVAKFPGDQEDIDGDRDFARQAVKRGYAALAVEQRAFGECGGTEKGPDCHQPAVQALLLGRTLIGERCWDIKCALEAVFDLFPNIDKTSVALMGNSGGGTTTFYASALYPFISAAMPSCAFSGFLPSIGAQRHCICNYVPGIMKEFDMAELAGLIAPRPLVIVSGQHDGIFPIESAKEQFAIARENYYAPLGAQDRIRHVIGLQGHRFYADDAWPVFEALTGWGKR
ncbi:MAG: alpha/beta hydrolase family protein [Clostridiales bacterium]|nr:alpha/beta hydrolase family protein [Clostridiales bacterium]